MIDGCKAQNLQTFIYLYRFSKKKTFLPTSIFILRGADFLPYRYVSGHPVLAYARMYPAKWMINIPYFLPCIYSLSNDDDKIDTEIMCRAHDESSYHRKLVSVPLVDLCQEKEKLSCFHPYRCGGGINVGMESYWSFHSSGEEFGTEGSNKKLAAFQMSLKQVNNGGSRTTLLKDKKKWKL